MKIRTKEAVKAFQAAIDECTNTVWLTSAKGEQYNMKSERDWFRGISRLLNDEHDELEIYASNYHDEAIMMGFYKLHCA